MSGIGPARYTWRSDVKTLCIIVSVSCRCGLHRAVTTSTTAATLTCSAMVICEINYFEIILQLVQCFI